MLTVCFYCLGVIHYEYAPEGQNITTKYYLEVLRSFRDEVRRKTQDLWADGWIKTTHQQILHTWSNISWRNTEFLWFARLPTPQILLLVISGYSQTSKTRYSNILHVEIEMRRAPVTHPHSIGRHRRVSYSIRLTKITHTHEGLLLQTTKFRLSVISSLLYI